MFKSRCYDEVEMMFARIARPFIALVVLALLVGVTSAPLAAQGPIGNAVLSTGEVVLGVTGQSSTQAYLQQISSSTQSAWVATKNTFSAPPQQIGPFSNGSGQITLPGLGPVMQVGTYTQDLVIPNGIPVLGGWNTGIQTRVDVVQDAQGKRYDVAVDPLSAANYALTHPNASPNNVESGYALFATVLVDQFTGNSPSGSNAFRWDPGLAAALDVNFGQGLGSFLGAAVYEYPAPEALSGIAAGTTSQEPLGTSGGTTGASVVPPLPSNGEQIYLKAVIPQAPPSFDLQLAPPFPVVVGQDPSARGVDAHGQATLNPCTVIWHHVLHLYYYYCGPNQPKCGPSSPNVEIRETTKEWDTTQLEPDALASAAVDATLTPESIAYITGPLAQRYPGAHVLQGHVAIYPSQWAQVTANYVGIPSGWVFQALRVPFADPGKWDIHAALNTTGTPHCSPLHWSKDYPDLLTVWLREQRLTK